MSRALVSEVITTETASLAPQLKLSLPFALYQKWRRSYHLHESTFFVLTLSIALGHFHHSYDH